MLRVGDILDNKYRILTLIGKGGMSKVWLAMDKSLNKQWAVKEINKNSGEYKRTVNENKTLSEIEIMKKLDHPALPRIVSVIDTVDEIYVVMDYIEGETLLNILKAYGEQDEEMVAGWMMEICDALDYLHHQNPPIIYRDMKPSNVMLTQDGKIKIIDFGIAREYKGDRDDTLPLGTRGYASPEHFTKKTDARSDVYTLGVTMYQLLTGKDPTDPPYEILPLREVNPELSTGLEKIIEKATMQDPEKRYQTIGEMADAIQSYKKLEEGYIESRKKLVRKYQFSLIASVLTIVIGLSLIIGGTLIDRNTYEKLINAVASNTEERVDNLKRASKIRPSEITPYVEMIKAYSEDGKFTEEENSEFASIYNENRDSINSSRNANDINFEIGEAILKYYTGETDSSSRAKLLAAEPYFIECSEDYPKFPLSDSYVFMSEYYKDHVIVSESLVSEDTGRETYNELLSRSKDIVKEISSYEDDTSGKMKLITYEIVLGLIDGERRNLAEQNMSIESVLSVPEDIISKLSTLRVNSEALIKKKEEIEKRALSVKENIEFTYKNKEKEG